MISRRSRTLQSPKYLQKKRKKAVVTVFLSVACVFICLVAAILTLRLPFLQITSVILEKPGDLPASELERKVLAVTEGSYLHVIPRSSTFFYPKKEMEAAVMDAYEKIENMHIVKKSFTTLEITATERQPEAIVCEGFREEDQAEKCFFADKGGRIYSESPGFSEGVYPKYYVNSDSDNLIVGMNFIDSAKFNNLQDFIKNVRASGISTLGILIGDGSYELYIKNRDQSTAVVYFDDRTAFDKTVSNLAAFWDNKKDNFNYINLRFGNNVFYSLK